MNTPDATSAHGFSSLALSADLLAVISELGFDAMTPIQAAAIPPLLDGRDLVGQSQTGSGKTAAFALPILQRLDMSSRDLQALVLCPTRELCAQVAAAIRTFGRRHRGLHVIALAGGVPLRPQAYALHLGAHVAVGTPGRVLDHLARRTLDLDGVRTVVLDEADRMLDMGFQDDVEAVLEAAPRERQMVFFSATVPAAFESMCSKHLRDAVRVTARPPKGDADAAPAAVHEVLVVADDKPPALAAALGAFPHESALVFANMKVTVAEVVRSLAAAGWSVDALHGDLAQPDRDLVLAKFRNGSTRVLVATDVAARGLDVKDLDLVINYDLPPQAETYVHRVGRTGRAGKAGTAVSIATGREEGKAPVHLSRVVLPPYEGAPRPAAMDTVQIAGGRKEKVRRGDIVGALTGEAAGLAATDLGLIEIHDHFSFVAVARARSREAVAGLMAGKLKGRRFQARVVP